MLVPCLTPSPASQRPGCRTLGQEESAGHSGAGATLASVVCTSLQPRSHRGTWQWIYSEDISVPISIRF